MKVTSKRLATIAGKYLEMSREDFCTHIERIGLYQLYEETLELAASVLSQAEKPKKRKVKK